MKNSNVHPVILCGGSGTRLWPLSRNSYPKQFLKIAGNSSLLQETVNRALSIAEAPAENLVLLTLSNFQADVAAQLNDIGQSSSHIISEPDARNTAAAIAYAAFYIQKNSGPDSLMWVLPSDHDVTRPDQLKVFFQKAIVAANLGHLVTFGIKPTRPETGYGYINIDCDVVSEGVHSVRKFVEKPNLQVAKDYLESGDYLWNSGMFLFRVDAILNELEIHAPAIYEVVKNSYEAANEKNAPLLRDYQKIPKLAIDVAVMEESQKVAVIPCEFGWSDVGSWESIWDISPKDPQGNVSKGDIISYNTSDSLLFSFGGRPIATCGISRTVVVDAGDIVLVANMDNTQEIKFLLQELLDRDLGHLLDK